MGEKDGKGDPGGGDWNEPGLSRQRGDGEEKEGEEETHRVEDARGMMGREQKFVSCGRSV